MAEAAREKEEATERLGEATEDTARTTGRGFLVISGAKVWFLISASILNFGLPVLFATPADYGTYGVVTNAVSLLNMVVITASMQAVAKLVSEQPHATRAVIRRALLLQCGLGLPLAGAYFALAGPIAAWLRDPAYEPLLRISAIIVAAYSFYALFVGCFNGLKAFTRQAALDIIFATLRTALILGAVAAGLGVAGAIGGFAAASVVILLVAGIWVTRYLRKRDAPVGGGDAGERAGVDGRRLLAFLVSIMLYTFVLNALMRVDLFALKRISAGVAGPSELISSMSNALAGAYTLMLNIARMPYQGVIAIAFVIFPMLSRSTFENDAERTRSYIRDTMRYSFMLVGVLAGVLAGAGGDVVRPVYPDYAYAVGALPLLCLAYAFFALMYVNTTMLIAAGRPWLSTGLTAATVVVVAGLCTVLIGRAAPGPEMLAQAGWAVLVGMGLGLVATGITSLRLYGAFIRLESALRIGGAMAAIMVLGELTAFSNFVEFADPLPAALGGGADGEVVGEAARTMIGSKTVWLLAAMGKATVLGLLYIGILLVTGEIDQEDKARIKRVLKRGAKDETNDESPGNDESPTERESPGKEDEDVKQTDTTSKDSPADDGD